MTKGLLAKQTIAIQAPVTAVWEALTNPAKIKLYLFGTDTVTDWKVGSPITYSGVWNCKAYEDKGKILQIEPNQLLQFTHWSVMSGTADAPENYFTVTYKLFNQGEVTELTVTQENIAHQKAKEESEKNWGIVLQGIKAITEK